MEITCAMELTIQEGKRVKAREGSGLLPMPKRVIFWRDSEKVATLSAWLDTDEFIEVLVVACQGFSATTVGIIADSLYTPAEPVGSEVFGQILTRATGPRRDALIATAHSVFGEAGIRICPYAESANGITWLTEIRYDDATAGGVIGDAIVRIMQLPRMEHLSGTERVICDIRTKGVVESNVAGALVDLVSDAGSHRRRIIETYDGPKA